MSLDFASFLSALMMLIGAVYAVHEASHFPRGYRVAPGLLAASLCLMLADRGMDLLNVELTYREFLFGYLTSIVRGFGGLTIISLVVAHKRCREGKLTATQCGYVATPKSKAWVADATHL